VELRRLRYFVAVAETGNVTRAAHQCFVAQSALSAQIAQLEAEVGTALFVRSRRGMHLTAAGDVLRPLAQHILADVAYAEAAMAELRGVLIGRLRLGMIQGPPADLDVIGLVATFHHRHPGVELRVSTGASDDLAAAVADGGLDLAVVAKRDDLPTQLVLRRWADDPLMAVLPSAGSWRGPGPITIAELVSLGPFIHYRRRSGLRRSVEQAFQRAGVTVDAPFELDLFADMLRLAGLGVGVTILPSSALAGSALTPTTEGGDPRIVALDDAAAVHAIGVIAPSRPSPAARAFLSLLDPNH